MAVRIKAKCRPLIKASDKLPSNTERVLWDAHVRAAQLLDDEPGPVSRTIFDAIHHRWRPVFLGGVR